MIPAMHRYTIIRRITPLSSGDYACTVMAVRQDIEGRNQFDVKICADLAEAERTGEALERQIRESLAARGDVVATSS
jgi:hypothetical protein